MSTVQEAVEQLGEVWDEYSALDLGPHLTCGEAESLAALFEALGYPFLAAALIEGHADEDDEGDLHFKGAA